MESKAKLFSKAQPPVVTGSDAEAGDGIFSAAASASSMSAARVRQPRTSSSAPPPAVRGRSAGACAPSLSPAEPSLRGAESSGVGRAGQVSRPGQVQDSILSTPLARKLAGLRLDEDIAVSVLAEMQMRLVKG